mmetsp:Transcript_19695/g.34942  ORF Transcript_19695/g.34942 Transcript_19695/m.34942 type:complete len:148 (-) Transcript_19695:113-556(-)
MTIFAVVLLLLKVFHGSCSFLKLKNFASKDVLAERKGLRAPCNTRSTEYGLTEAEPIRVNLALSGASCACMVTAQEDCSCSDCSETDTSEICTQILGPCTCTRSDQAVCECQGFCNSKEQRQEACEDEPGCIWGGQWCEAELGMLWS